MNINDLPELVRFGKKHTLRNSPCAMNEQGRWFVPVEPYRMAYGVRSYRVGLTAREATPYIEAFGVTIRGAGVTFPGYLTEPETVDE